MSARHARSHGSWKSSVVRGDVHAITLPRRRGHVQHGRRFAVVVQADDLLTLSTIVVCPTSTSTPAVSFHPEVVVAGEETRVMCEMVGAVDVRALGEHAGHLTLDELRAVDDALELVLDLG
jgi:mRNA interferase MazF